LATDCRFELNVIACENERKKARCGRCCKEVQPSKLNELVWSGQSSGQLSAGEAGPSNAVASEGSFWEWDGGIVGTAQLSGGKDAFEPLNPTLVASTTRPPLNYSLKTDELQTLFDNLIEGWEGVDAHPCSAMHATLHAAAAFPYQLDDQPVLCVQSPGMQSASRGDVDELECLV
jgi:hypothetical protein